jgi:hypothetical protein
MTATEPLPADASEVSCDIAEKSRVNEVGVRFTVPVELDELPPVLGLLPPDELLLHAEATSPAASSAAANALLLLIMDSPPSGFVAAVLASWAAHQTAVSGGPYGVRA